MALAWQAEQAELCAGCGLPCDEAMDPTGESAYVARPVRCHACTARASAAEAFTGQMGGMYWAVDRHG